MSFFSYLAFNRKKILPEKGEVSQIHNIGWKVPWPAFYGGFFAGCKTFSMLLIDVILFKLFFKKLCQHVSRYEKSASCYILKGSIDFGVLVSRYETRGVLKKKRRFVLLFCDIPVGTIGEIEIFLRCQDVRWILASIMQEGDKWGIRFI